MVTPTHNISIIHSFSQAQPKWSEHRGCSSCNLLHRLHPSVHCTCLSVSEHYIYYILVCIAHVWASLNICSTATLPGSLITPANVRWVNRVKFRCHWSLPSATLADKLTINWSPSVPLPLPPSYIVSWVIWTKETLPCSRVIHTSLPLMFPATQRRTNSQFQHHPFP